MEIQLFGSVYQAAPFWCPSFLLTIWGHNSISSWKLHLAYYHLIKMLWYSGFIRAFHWKQLPAAGNDLKFSAWKNNNKQDDIETANQHGIQSQSTQLTFVVGWQFSAFIMNINLDILSVCWPIERILHLKCNGHNGGNGGKVKKGSSKTLNS